VLITGASRGLGAALAIAYSQPGRRVALVARERPALDAVASQCVGKGAQAVWRAFSVADVAATRAFVDAVEKEGPIDLLIVNAGEFWGNGAGGRLEPLERALSQVRSNLEGAIVSVDAVLRHMRSRRCGRIALVSSLAALHPLADAPAYSATKSGLAAYGIALRELLHGENIGVSIIYPGHIETAQTARHVGPLPQLMQTRQAARIIRDGLDRGRSHIAFPRSMLWLVRLSALLPWRMRTWLGRGFRFHVDERRGSQSRIASD
jgi:short-subunit dehydrogenase